MPDYDFETPKYESGNRRIEKPEKMHLPCILLVDTSEGMNGLMGELNEAINMLMDDILEYSWTEIVFEICVITFDDEARVVVPFGTVQEYEAPKLTAEGSRATHKAVDLGLEQIEIRCAEYRASRTDFPCYRPHMFLMTCGKPDDEGDGAFERLLTAQTELACIFRPIAIGDAVDMDFLKAMNKNHFAFRTENVRHNMITTGNGIYYRADCEGFFHADDDPKVTELSPSMLPSYQLYIDEESDDDGGKSDEGLDDDRIILPPPPTSVLLF